MPLLIVSSTLELSETVSIHQRHLRFLVTEVYKLAHNLKNGQVLSLPPARLTYGYFRGSLIWNNLPSYIKPSRSVCEFKNNINNSKDTDCGCLVCRT